MALTLENGYVPESTSYDFAMSRYPNNFTATAPDPDFRAALLAAGDVITANDENWLGVKRSGLTGGRVWPRQLEGGGDSAPYLTTTLPEELLRGYNFLAIAIALIPEHIGTTSNSSVTNVSASGLKKAEWDNLKVELFEPSSTTRTTKRDTDTPTYHDYLFGQAKYFLDVLVRPDKQLELPGFPEEQPVPTEKGYYTFGDFCPK